MTELTRINDSSNPESNDPEFSNITEFYSGCNVLVTDASDFINKLIIEKLLRSCPKIGKLFILVKPKSGLTYKDRLESTFSDVLYERLEREQPDFKSRVTLIEGDTSASKLGLSSTSREFLRKNTTVVIHKPGTIRCCDDRLRRAVGVNVRAVKLMLQLAAEMPNLKAFVHVSSVFSHYRNQYVNERFYKPRKSSEKVMSLMDLLDDNLLGVLTPNIIGGWPNANTFTQCLAEEVVQMYGSTLPTGIVRSAIALSTYREPASGFVDGSHEITKSLASVALGAIHVLHIDGRCNAEIVPADYVVNNVLAAAWDVHENWNASKCTNVVDKKEPLIYNCVSSCQRAINWSTFILLNQSLASKEPSIMTFWYHYLILVNDKWLYKVCKILLHLLPAVIVDTFSRPINPNRKLCTIYKKIHKVNDTLTFYGFKQWVFGNNNATKLWKKMSFADRRKFNFNVRELDWKEYVMYYTRGLRSYFFEDSMTSLKNARRKYIKLIIAHYGLIISLCFFLASIIVILS